MKLIFAVVFGLFMAAPVLALGSGSAAAEREIGMAYYQGRDRVTDYVKAVEHLARAVDLGDAESAIRLGKMYEYGMGVAADAAQATLWYTRGAELGHGQAQFEASVRYYKGDGVARDPVEAVKWWTLALSSNQARDHMRISAGSAEAKLTPDELSRGRAAAKAWLQRRTLSPIRKAS